MTNKLTQYHFPDDLKSMDDHQLDLLTVAIRDFLIENVSKTGGHLASNLGIVELTLALHKVFDSPRDKIIWDVGHQSYVHKILTGRAGDFATLRQIGGLSGFPKSKESVHDVYETGHSSTSISAAAGIAAARDLKGEDYEVIAVIGDGSLTGGMAYEALNNVGASKSKVMVILNDNGMSISRNIGGVSQHLSKLRMSDGYLSAKKAIKKTIKRIPVVGGDMTEGLAHVKDRIKYALLSGGVIFEELGFTYLGPVDGHNLGELLEVLELAKHVSLTGIIHVITKKERGTAPQSLTLISSTESALSTLKQGALRHPSGVTYSKVFGDTLVRLAEKDSRITAISAAMVRRHRSGTFCRRVPKEIF